MSHRIALSGGSSSGKTTLLKALADDGEIASVIPMFLPEGTRELLISTGQESFDSLSREELRNFQRHFFAWKRDREEGLSGFVVDRSFVDVAAVWRERDTFDEPEDVQNELVVPCRKLAEKYTLHVLVPPFGKLVDDGIRERDVDLHSRIIQRIAAYLGEWRLSTLTLQTSTVADRVAEIRTALELRD